MNSLPNFYVYKPAGCATHTYRAIMDVSRRLSRKAYNPGLHCSGRCREVFLRNSNIPLYFCYIGDGKLRMLLPSEARELVINNNRITELTVEQYVSLLY